MKFIMVVIIRPLDLINVGLVHLLRVGSSELDNDRSLLWDRRVHTSTVDVHLGSTVDWSAKWRDSKSGKSIDHVHWIVAVVVKTVEGNIKSDNITRVVPKWSSASDLIGQSSVFHATNWAGLHESIGVLNVCGVLLTGESAGEVSVISEDVWMVLSPFE